MDYFKNLQSKITHQKTQPTHAEQLAKFHNAWEGILGYFEQDEKKVYSMPANVNQTEIPQRLKEMVGILVEEGLYLEEVNTGVCMEEFLKNNVLKELVKLSKDDAPLGIRGEIIRAVRELIDLLDDRFLVHNSVHQPTVSLLRTCVHDEQQSEVYDEDLVDLMYIICSKIHGFPALLNIFFYDANWLTTPQKYTKKELGLSLNISNNQDGNIDDGASMTSNSTTDHAKTTEFTEETEKPEYEFFLFAYLLQFVHREGKCGDFARTGLLFIMELADGQLADYILESDFANIMAAGLGALYSQLPRKLMVKSSSGGLTNATLLRFGDNTSAELEKLRSGGIEVSSSPAFKSQLDSFLKLLEFCQDILNRCPNSEISTALLQNIKAHFLENILYPSILECSDTDGSSVAVISYIDIILQTLDQEELVDLVVGFLMDSDSDEENSWNQTLPNNKAAKRQSTINWFSGIDTNSNTSSPYFTAIGRFTLKDLIFSRLRSSSQSTVIAALKLLQNLISKHCWYSIKLLNIELDENATCFPSPNYMIESFHNNDLHSLSGAPIPKPITMSHHLRELDLFYSLILAINPKQSVEIITNGYESYVRDAEANIEADLCYRIGQDLEWTEEGPAHPKTNKNKGKNYSAYSQGKNPKKHSHAETHHVLKHKLNPTDRLKPADSLLQILIGTLSNFFAHSPELNLTLTGVISALAICPYRSLEGWLVFSGADRLDSRQDSSAKDFESLQHEARNLERSLGIIASSSDSSGSGNKKSDVLDESDDRSIDHDFEKSALANNTIGVVPKWANFPPFFTIFKTLTQQVDYYRSEIEDFDQYLDERRSGLLDTEDEIDENFFRQQSSTAFASRASPKGIPSNSSNTNLRRNNSLPMKAPQRSRSFSRKDTSSTSPINSPLSSFKSSPISSNIVTPLTTHFSKTESIKIKPLFPANFVNEEEDPIDDIGEEEDDELTSSKKQTRTKSNESKPKEITLSTLLNNVVILEEAIKELVAIIQVRRSLGIDEVRYL
ncbi:5547_t:CDS:2 [Entrophospora sp. SA101]|nr:5547_t:CDS:2 [Entrophospora sp. SA101]CAJ0828776.1 20182_t:CDS:2 [Entrophospora sp. SA101]CAJ0874436.1 16978_t:CDS:2 [Entrophospora sp. SA101]CAJ0906651.1 302_t:CDS:2 [Entrophospora sp. SA101]